MSPVETERPPARTPDRDWRVMVVEDNPAVAALHRRIIDAVPYLKTAHVAWNGDQAFKALATVRPDLVILDLTMPGGDGMLFLRRLRREGIPIDVVVVTASRGAQVVNEAMHHGVVDYLVKPFNPQRLRHALAAFAVRRRMLTCRRELAQADVDAVQASGSPRQRRRLPKGLREATLKSVVRALEQSDEPLSADEVGRHIRVARVTARRYLEHLVLMGVVEMSRETSGPGRPRNRYRLRPKASR